MESESRPLEIRVRTARPQDPEAELWLAGSLNRHQPGQDPRWRFERLSASEFRLKLNLPAGRLEEGLVLRRRAGREAWECAADGGAVANRLLGMEPGERLWTVSAFSDEAEPLSSARGDLRLWTGLTLPEPLVSGRSVRVLVPPGYDDDPNHRYPVLYLQDGQNLFDRTTGFGGLEWGVDKVLLAAWAAGRLPPFLVVGIDNSSERLCEYSPWPFHTDLFTAAEGRGFVYADWLAQTLKPRVDQAFRTRPERTWTAIGGSSLGAVISHVTALRHQRLFGRVLSFSAAWFRAYDNLADRFLTEVASLPRTHPLRIWMDIGESEVVGDWQGDVAVDDNLHVLQGLGREAHAEDQICFEVVRGAQHHEEAWGERLERALTWLWSGGEDPWSRD